ncbi:hypothetical protein GCM10023235_64570 [Kitasatospora terrestris]|uniref:Uncharacterized protein n=1 Tax=Kitasatospora terrestris TaxID=258051 RepID=A0ABP9EGV9_9ACTN
MVSGSSAAPLHRPGRLASAGRRSPTRLLDLTGCPDSAGVRAPNLSYADGLFHLLFSNVSSCTGGFTDCPNFLVTAPAIDGPWSDPVPLHARGFDTSLFHDGADSRLLNLVHDWRPGYGGSAGLEATRYDRAARRLVGGPRPLALPPRAGWTEGPNLYRRGPWYYLLTADGGTGWEHRVTVARSRALTGPHERDPRGPLVTARDRPGLPLQKAGHGSLTEAADGRWWLAYLVARPLGRCGPCVLGRETALAPVEWTADGRLRVPTGLPAVAVHLATPPVAAPHVPAPPSVDVPPPTRPRRQAAPTRPRSSRTRTTSTARCSARHGPRCAAPPARTGSASPSGPAVCGCAAAAPRRAWSVRAWWPAG